MRCLLVFCLAAWALPATAGAALQPEEIAILAVESSKESRELAEYYAGARGIPKEQICVLDIPAGETLSRDDWESRVRPAIRRWLSGKQLDDKIRCFVTTRDVPLKIGPIDAAHPVVTGLQKNFETQLTLRQDQLKRLSSEIDAILPGDDKHVHIAPGADAPPKAYADLLETALRGAQGRVKAAQERKDAAAPGAVQELERLYFLGGGGAALVRSLQTQLQKNTRPPVELLRGFELRRGEVAGLRAGLAALSGMRESVSRDQQMLALMQQSDGLLGILSWIEQNRELWRKNETHSSFDSELTLLHFSPYSLLRWQNSATFHSFGAFSRESLPRTLLVSRLEAPTLEQTKKLIDDGIATEKTGLVGKVYLDARGMAAEKSPGSYGDFDQSLRDLETFLKENTSLEVVLDDKDELFQSGDCPDAALYCGWYSLGKYVDAFQWKPGAVGYHLASSEATTLRKAGSTVWCKRMLESGVCATLGPAYEPYLAAFPRPLDFFPLLLSGEYSLAETYALTNPFKSWVMVLVGDPLYNPFRNNSPFDRNNRPEHLERLVQERR
jgi:uncharacterized protein (TIGR03790 family)